MQLFASLTVMPAKLFPHYSTSIFFTFKTGLTSFKISFQWNNEKIGNLIGFTNWRHKNDLLLICYQIVILAKGNVKFACLVDGKQKKIDKSAYFVVSLFTYLLIGWSSKFWSPTTNQNAWKMLGISRVISWLLQRKHHFVTII